MRSGLEFVENSKAAAEWQRSGNMVASALTLPLSAAPGERHRYSTADAHLLSAALSKATGQSTYEYMRTRLLDLLGIRLHAWNVDASGYYQGGSEMQLTPRDMAKLGFPYLNGGRWGDRQVVPAD